MSIASRIESIENHLSDDYTEIARLGADLTNVDKNIENIAEAVREAYSKLPKVLGTGSNISLSPTLKGGLDITPIGACEQDTTTGKNKLSYTLAILKTTNITGTWNNNIYSLNGLTFEVNEDLTIKVNGTATGESYTRFALFGTPFNFSANTNYFMSGCANGGSLTTYMLKLNVTGDSDIGSGKLINRTSDFSSGIYIQIETGTQCNNLLFKPQIELGTSATSYEMPIGITPNPDYPQDVRVVTGDNDVVVQNKNLIDTSVVKNVTNDSGQSRQGFYFIADSDGNYTIDFNYSANPCYYRAVDSLETDVAITSSYNSDTTKTHTFTLEKGNALILWGINAVNEKILLVKGSTLPSEFIAHAEQKVTLHIGTNYLAGINEYDDEIVGKKDDWKVRRYVGKVVFNGTENWSINNTGTENFYYRYRYISNNRYTGGSGTFLCNEFSFAQVGNSTTDEGMFITQVGEIRVRFGTEMTIEDFKTWLSTHNIILYYQLETPTETPITDTTLITDLNNMYNLMGYDGQTNITISSNSSNAQMTAQVSALKGE